MPEGFQRAEFLLSHGLIDMIVTRGDMKRVLSDLLRLMGEHCKKDGFELRLKQ